MIDRPTPNDMFREAQRLIRQGQPVFPCWSEGDKAKRPIGTLVHNGVKNATLDKDLVKRWLRAHPDLALGIATGVRWDVLDVDVKSGEDGRVHLPGLHKLGLLNGCKRVVRTPSGGFHLYFNAQPGLTNKAKKTLGLDVRSKGGYVLAPPSYINDHKKSDGCYVDEGETSGSTDEPLRWSMILASLEPTDELTSEPIDLLPHERRNSLASLRVWLADREEGERNNALFWATCRCIEAGLDPTELIDVAVISLGLPEDETTKSVHSALKRAGLRASDLQSEVDFMFGE